MKKYICIIAIAGSALMSASAQRFVVGLRPALNISHYWGEDISSGTGDFLPGLNFGAYFGYYPHPRIAIVTEFNYAMRGAAYDFTTFGVTTRGYDRLNYLEIPVFAEVYFLTTGFFRPSFYVGPSFNVLANANGRIYEPFDAEAATTDDYKRFDLGVGAGLNFQMHIWRFSIIPGIRYTLGLLDVPDSESVYKNGTIQIGVGVGFNFD